uniref:hypothetical protein n=1 Tax=uncultured Parasutterella sp. TaxID=1263098 RepID=UPI0034A43FC4
ICLLKKWEQLSNHGGWGRIYEAKDRNKAIARSDQAIAEHEAWAVSQQEQIVHALELLDKDFRQLLG